MTELETNDRFDSLTNRDISTHYRDKDYWFNFSDFMGAFSYWVVAQSPYVAPDITEPLRAFGLYLETQFQDPNLPEQFSYDRLSKLIHEDTFESIPEIERLNNCLISHGAEYDDRHNNPSPDFDFIDLGALARNVFYMLLREHITQNY